MCDLNTFIKTENLNKKMQKLIISLTEITRVQSLNLLGTS
jgi:hypothetical protein